MSSLPTKQLSRSEHPSTHSNRAGSRTAVRSALLVGLLASAGFGQSLSNLSFGSDDTLDVVAWNIERFPKQGQTTINLVEQIIVQLEAEVIAIQECDDRDAIQDIVDNLPGYEANYESTFYAGLTYVYDTRDIEVVDIYEIYTTQPFWSPFPRSPQVMEMKFRGKTFFLMNNHFKCCGNGILSLSNPNDEETRRYRAANLLKDYIDINLPDERVIVLGDLNDLIQEPPPNNVFQNIIDDSQNYQFADMAVANGPIPGWSYPSWPSHIDHILITNEIFADFEDGRAICESIKIDDYLPGGFSEYDNKISDHRPVGLSIPVPVENSGCPGELAPQCIGKPSATAPFSIQAPALGASCTSATVMLVGVCETTPFVVAPPLGCGTCGLTVVTAYGTVATPLALPAGLLPGFRFCVQAACIAGSCVSLSAATDVTILP